jgi:hypothetical protein
MYYPLSKNLHARALLHRLIDELTFQAHFHLKAIPLPHYLFTGTEHIAKENV